MAILYWFFVVVGALGYGLVGLYVVIRLEQVWRAAFDEVMGSTVAVLVGWLLWPLSIVLVLFCHWSGPDGAADGRSKL